LDYRVGGKEFIEGIGTAPGGQGGKKDQNHFYLKKLLSCPLHENLTIHSLFEFNRFYEKRPVRNLFLRSFRISS
jgi:hypothetical protein